MKKQVFLAALLTVPAMSFSEAADQIAEEHFRKAIAAVGGEDRLDTIKAPTMWMETGTYYGAGAGVPFVAQYASYWPKRWYRQWIEGQFAIGVAGDEATIFSGDVTNGRKLSGPALEDRLHQTRVEWAQLLYPLIEDDYTLWSVSGVDVEGKPTIGIRAVHASGSEVKLYFDKSTFLLVKTEAKIVAREMGDKRVKSETFFGDHKSFGGAKLPSKYKVLYDGKLMVEGVTAAIKVHATIDPAWFGADGPPRVR